MEAALHLERMEELTRILRDAGILTQVLRTTQPGYITYEDRHQVAAVPFTTPRAASCPALA
jgi:hypothetical protein